MESMEEGPDGEGGTSRTRRNWTTFRLAALLSLRLQKHLSLAVCPRNTALSAKR